MCNEDLYTRYRNNENHEQQNDWRIQIEQLHQDCEKLYEKVSYSDASNMQWWAVGSLTDCQ